MEIQRKLIKFLSWWRLRVFDESGDCPIQLENLSISLGILIEDWWQSRLLRIHLQQPDFAAFSRWENSDSASLQLKVTVMLLNVGLILSWVIIFETRCVFRKKLSRFQVAPNVSQIFSSPCAQCQVVCSEKEPLILNISPLDLSRSHRLTPFCRISSAFNKSKVFFLLSLSFAFVSRTPTVHS